MYSAADLPPANRRDAERRSDHPLMRAWMDMRASKSSSRDEVRSLAAPVYMGLIRELDDHLGRLFAYLEEGGRLKDTMVVFCSDHGDNMGDHWMGEKDLFYDCSVRVPLIVCDPRTEADPTRGASTDALVEGIDVAPTFIEYFGGNSKPHILEGRSLAPLIRGQKTEWRTFCVSEYDYSTRDARREIGIDQKDARIAMIFDGRWKYIHFERMRPMLFDLESDPNELNDLGTSTDFREQAAPQPHYTLRRRYRENDRRQGAARNPHRIPGPERIGSRQAFPAAARRQLRTAKENIISAIGALTGAIAAAGIAAAAHAQVNLAAETAPPVSVPGNTILGLAEAASGTCFADIQVSPRQTITKAVMNVAQGSTDIAAASFALPFLLSRGAGPYSAT